MLAAVELFFQVCPYVFIFDLRFFSVRSVGSLACFRFSPTVTLYARDAAHAVLGKNLYEGLADPPHRVIFFSSQKRLVQPTSKYPGKGLRGARGSHASGRVGQRRLFWAISIALTALVDMRNAAMVEVVVEFPEGRPAPGGSDLTVPRSAFLGLDCPFQRTTIDALHRVNPKNMLGMPSCPRVCDAKKKQSSNYTVCF